MWRVIVSKNMLDKINLLGVEITSATTSQILEYLLQGLKNTGEKFFIATPNPEILVFAQNHPSFKKVLNEAKIALPDGVGIIFAGQILRRPFKERITGVDFLEMVCREIAEKPITVGFLGAGPGIAEAAADCLKKKYSGLKVVFASDEWREGPVPGFPHASVSSHIRFTTTSVRAVGSLSTRATPPNLIANHKSEIDILFVAFGFPKQEEWIAENLPKIPVRVAIGVGGAFDYISGNVTRAPRWIQKAGFEWFYRLIRQPWRLKRQLALLKFIYLVLKEKLKQNSI